MPPNVRRFLPLVLIALVFLFILPSLRKKHTSGPSSATLSAQTIDAIDRIDQGEQRYKTAHGRYTPHLADLLGAKLAGDLGTPHLAVQLDASTDGQRYVAQVSSDLISLVRARSGDKITTQSCVILKSGSGVTCTAPLAPATP
jgi:hypothetical protein